MGFVDAAVVASWPVFCACGGAVGFQIVLAKRGVVEHELSEGNAVWCVAGTQLSHKIDQALCHCALSECRHAGELAGFFARRRGAREVGLLADPIGKQGVNSQRELVVLREELPQLIQCLRNIVGTAFLHHVGTDFWNSGPFER